MHLTPVDDLNVLGILVAALAHFALGAAWYSPPLFLKPWAAALGIQMDGSGPNIAVPLAVNAVEIVVTTAVVATVYLWGGGDGPLDGIVAGLLIGAGIVAMENLNRPMYERSPWVIYWINSGFAVSGFALSGLVYALIA